MDSTSAAADADLFAAQAEELRAQLRVRLNDADYRLVLQLCHLEELATVAACTAAEQRLLEALVAHFPAHALALQAVIAHIRATDAACDTLQGRATGQEGA